jgi:hypothetical protein
MIVLLTKFIIQLMAYAKMVVQEAFHTFVNVVTTLMTVVKDLYLQEI